MKVVDVTKISQNGTVRIPKELREKYGLVNGSKVMWLESNGKILIEKVS